MNVFWLRVWRGVLSKTFFSALKLYLSLMTGEDKSKPWNADWLNGFWYRGSEQWLWRRVGLQAVNAVQCGATVCSWTPLECGRKQLLKSHCADSAAGTKVRRGTENKMQPGQYPLNVSMGIYISCSRNEKVWHKSAFPLECCNHVEVPGMAGIWFGAFARRQLQRERAQGKVGQESRSGSVLRSACLHATALCHTHVHTRTAWTTHIHE